MNTFPLAGTAPERIVSLVPSMTESLFDLGHLGVGQPTERDG